MILEINIGNRIAIHSLDDLCILGKLEEAGTTKLNKSQIARELNVDRRTVDKYIKGYKKSNTRNRSSKLDEYYDLVDELLDDDSTQVFFYKRVLWQYLKDNHQLDCSESSFRRWISKNKDFQSYFNGIRNRTVNGEKRDCTTTHHAMHYITLPGEEAQLDWKESMNMLLNDGTIVSINIFALVYSYSRFKIYQLSLTKTQNVLFHLLDNAFEQAGGVPAKLRTDNMKTVMDEARTQYRSGKINNKFKQFADDYGFQVKPCRAGEPQVKAKVEAPMKILDELYAYNGMLDIAGLNQKLMEINNRVNSSCHPETGKIPILHINKEKDSLTPLPKDKIRNLYQIKSSSVKVNSQSTITYKGNYYSVPPAYIGKRLTIQIHDNYLHVYCNTNLVTIHEIIEGKKRNYHESHYIEITGMSVKGSEEDIEKFAKNNLKEIGEIYK